MTEIEPRPAIEASEVSAPFWQATRDRRLVMQRCPTCDDLVWYPRAMCPRCLGTDLRWEDVPGEGTVHAVSVHHRTPVKALTDRLPLAVALVDLDAGPRLMSNVVGVPAGEVRVGQRVVLAWEPLEDGAHLPVFVPVGP
jgi:uncharacterized OB-fold protein